MGSLAQYLKQVYRAIANEDGPELIELFRLDGPGLALAMQGRVGAQNQNEVKNALGQHGKDWGDIVWGFLRALTDVCQGQKQAACEGYREQFAKKLLGFVSGGVWLLPVVIMAAKNLRELSTQADEDAVKRGQGHGKQLTQCASYLQSLFGQTASAKGADAEQKKSGALGIACMMIKVNFKLNTLNNCKQVIGSLEGPLKGVLGMSNLCDLVTFRYYTGRLAAYDEDYAKAEQDLSWALSNCDPNNVNNKRKILRYLIPVRMLLGVLPTDQMLQESGLTEYWDMAQGVRTGNVNLFMTALNKHQVALVQTGVFLLFEKLQLATYRRLFKKCALIHAATSPAKATQVPVDMFACALKLQDVEKDEVELHCLLANLIYRKYIKGYIAYKQKVVVLAKTDAFPPLATVQLGDPFG